MGGVCKKQGRIHRVLMTRDYWGFHLHVPELQSTIRTETGFDRLTPPFGFATHCPGHCMPRVAQEIRVIRTYRRPYLPPACASSPITVHLSEERLANNGMGLARYLS